MKINGKKWRCITMAYGHSQRMTNKLVISLMSIMKKNKGYQCPIIPFLITNSNVHILNYWSFITRALLMIDWVLYAFPFQRLILLMTLPVLLLQNSKSVAGQIKYLVYCMENAILHLPSNQEQMVWLVDYWNFSLSNISLKSAKEAAHVLQNHYPERLGVAILYNPPRLFEQFYKVFLFFLIW